jgi:hypothetical protein
MKSTYIGREEIKLSLFKKTMIVYAKNPKELTTTTKTNKEGSRIQGYHTKVYHFPYTSNSSI